MVKARDDAPSYTSPAASLENVTIAGNTITGNERGIRFGEPGKNNAGPTNVTVTNNNIAGNVKSYGGSDGSAYGGIVNFTLSEVDATENWWGNVSGPAGDGPGTGDAVAGINAPVLFCPWLGAEYTGATPTTFGGLVTNVNTGESFCAIQPAIDDSDTLNGHTINISKGVYPEHVAVDKQLTLTGVGTNPVQDTIIDGTGLSIGSGISVSSGVTNVTIENLTVQDFAFSNSNHAGIAGAGGNHNFTVQNVQVLNNTGANGRGGVYLNGPVDSVLIDDVTIQGNPGRGIVIWNGFKTNITITNNAVTSLGCCGIELQDGTASGVTVTGNTVVSNGDSGMSFLGLTSGVGPNVISNNTVTNNGRFGIEIKNPNGTGDDTGDGSIVVENNTVSFTPSESMNVRDHADIAVFRRSFQSGNPDGYADIPTGVVIRNNTVSGYVQQNPASLDSEGFGIVIEGTSHKVTGNTLANNEVAIQEQGGNHPNANYVTNNAGDGLQDDGASPQYFGRGNAPVACGNVVGVNIFTGNTLDYRKNVANGEGTATNLDTGEIFCYIQHAIDDSDTDGGDTIKLSADTFVEQVDVHKAVTVEGQGASSSIIEAPDTLALSFTSGTNNYAIIYVHDVDATFKSFTLDGAGEGNGHHRFVGFGLHNAGGTIQDVDVIDVRNEPLDGNQSGIGIYAVADNGTPRTLAITNATVTGFQKNGMTLVGADLTVNVQGSTVSGAGMLGTGLPAQNGIQVSGGAEGSIVGNTISDIAYELTSWAAIGILVSGTAGPVDAQGNTITDVKNAIYYTNASGGVSGNTITFTPAIAGIDYLTGILSYSIGDPTAHTLTVSGNTVYGPGTTSGIYPSVGIGLYGVNSGILTATVSSNGVTEWDVAVEVYESGSDVVAEVVDNVLANSGTPYGTGVAGFAGTEVTIGDINDTGEANDISGFETGVYIAGTVAVDGNLDTIFDNTTGIQVDDGGTSTIRLNDLSNNDVGVEFKAGATSTELACNNFLNNPTDAVNGSVNSIDATYNYWDNLPQVTGTFDTSYRLDNVATQYPCESTVGTNIALFDAQGEEDEIQVTWATLSEEDLVGFNLYRSTDPAAPGATPLNDEMIGAQAAGLPTGASYEWVDTDVEPDVTYYYWLEVIDNAGTTTVGPVEAQLNDPTAVTLGGINSASPQPLLPALAVSLVALAAAGWLTHRRRVTR